jgi:HK97 family phage prohead protease
VKHLTLEAKTTVVDKELGTFSALASSWDADREGDVIERDAFDTTIRAWQTSGKSLPLLFEHSAIVVGAIDPHSMEATDEGLVVAGEVDRTEPEGQQTWRAIKSGVAGFSIGYLSESTPRKGGGRTLTEIDLLEISATTKPMHPKTRALSWKTADAGDDVIFGGLLQADREHDGDQQEIDAELVALAEKSAKAARPIKVARFVV